MDKWVNFVNKCLRFGIPKDSVFKLIEEIIIHKITYYSDITRANKNEISVIYPQCLHSFLLSNLNKNFIIKKLYMIVSYTIRYSGRNILDFLKNIRPEQYNSMLILEYRLLELCSLPTDEQSQPINLSDVEIVETFNDVQPIPKKSIKPTKKINILDDSTDPKKEQNNGSENKKKNITKIVDKFKLTEKKQSNKE